MSAAAAIPEEDAQELLMHEAIEGDHAERVRREGVHGRVSRTIAQRSSPFRQKTADGQSRRSTDDSDVVQDPEDSGLTTASSVDMISTPSTDASESPRAEEPACTAAPETQRAATLEDSAVPILDLSMPDWEVPASGTFRRHFTEPPKEAGSSDAITEATNLRQTRRQMLESLREKQQRCLERAGQTSRTLSEWSWERGSDAGSAQGTMERQTSRSSLLGHFRERQQLCLRSSTTSSLTSIAPSSWLSLADVHQRLNTVEKQLCEAHEEIAESSRVRQKLESELCEVQAERDLLLARLEDQSLLPSMSFDMKWRPCVDAKDGAKPRHRLRRSATVVFVLLGAASLIPLLNGAGVRGLETKGRELLGQWQAQATLTGAAGLRQSHGRGAR